MSDLRVRVVEIRCLHRDCWGARCSGCGAWLTKHAFEPADAEAEAVDVLERRDRYGHRCRAA